WGSGTHWVFAAFVTLIGAVIINKFEPWQVFSFFSILMIFQLIFVLKMMPETKGKSLEEIEKELVTFDHRNQRLSENLNK
ncbi:MAG: MFS transporter, partial [Flavobacteriaceae bacterium]|nr:MFS transporter [Flavobacteriaceae bacterium]